MHVVKIAMKRSKSRRRRKVIVLFKSWRRTLLIIPPVPIRANPMSPVLRYLHKSPKTRSFTSQVFHLWSTRLWSIPCVVFSFGSNGLPVNDFTRLVLPTRGSPNTKHCLGKANSVYAVSPCSSSTSKFS